MDERRVGGSPTIVGLVSRGILDAELAALLWLLIEGRVPVVVTSGLSGDEADLVLDGLLGLLPAGTRIVEVDRELDAGVSAAAGTGDAAIDTGGPAAGTGADGAHTGGPGADGVRTCLVARPLLTGGDGDARRLRSLLRRAAGGAGLAATARDASLADLLAHLSRSGVGLTDDELTMFGVVVVLGADGRIAATHYMRPLARDAGGHVQRLGPAVLASRDPGSGALEHFSWGIVPELAGRVGRPPGELESEQVRRAAYLDALVRTGLDRPVQVLSAIAAYGRPLV